MRNPERYWDFFSLKKVRLSVFEEQQRRRHQYGRRRVHDYVHGRGALKTEIFSLGYWVPAQALKKGGRLLQLYLKTDQAHPLKSSKSQQDEQF